MASWDVTSLPDGDFLLRLARGEIEVTAEVPVVDTSQVNTGVVWGDEYLKNSAVGSANRDYQFILSQAPGVSGRGGGNPSVFGSPQGSNSYLIDGVNVTDSGYGGVGTFTNVFGSLGTGVTYDFLEEVQVQTGGFEAEFGGYAASCYGRRTPRLTRRFMSAARDSCVAGPLMQAGQKRRETFANGSV
mgnify:CR=1 FL=1